MSEIEKVLRKCEYYDTEEREMICVYINEILNILDKKELNSLLNIWLYGFNFNE